MHCVDEEIKNGKSKKDAQKMCAIGYYKRHGRTPQQDENKDAEALASMYEEIKKHKKKGKKDNDSRQSS